MRLITSAESRLAAISKVVRVRVRVLEEQVEDRLAAQQRHLLHVALAHRDELVGGVEDVADHLRGQPLGREQVLQAPVGARPAGFDLRLIGLMGASPRRGAASRSRWRAPGPRRRRPRSSRRGSRRDTGSSRPPRSASTARRTARGRPKSKSSFSAARMVRPVCSTSSTSTISRPSTGNGNLAAARFAMQADAAEVVAMQRDREQAQRRAGRERAMQPLGDPRAARVDADQRRVLRELAAHLLGHRAHERFGIRERGAHGPPAGRGSFAG